MAIEGENDELLYEVNEQGERVVVKSTLTNVRAFLRFSNLTMRSVDVWWRDFGGRRRHYVQLPPNGTYDINSFITHPWEFTDPQTKESYVINNKTIFRAPTSVGDMQYRTNWNITIGVRSLRDTALLAIALRIPYPELALNLELPQSLHHELRELIVKLNQPQGPRMNE